MSDVVVIDCGSHTTKVGLSGENLPRVVSPTVVGRDCHSTCYVGAEALARRSHVTLSRPVVHGRIQMWDEIEEVWQQIFSDDLHLSPDHHPVLLTESPGEPTRYREKKCEMFFENFGIPRFALATQSILALYADGRTSGVVVDIGHGHATVVPVLEGRTIPSAIVPIFNTGDNLTLMLLESLKQYGFRSHSSVHRDIANHIKDTLCYVSADKAVSPAAPVLYTLPDKTTLHLHPHQRDITSSFFSGPNSLQHTFNQAMSCLDATTRAALGTHVILAGGTTDCPGFRQTLSQELSRLGRYSVPPCTWYTPSQPYTVNPSKVSRGAYKAWVGGSVLSSLSSFSRISMTRQEYQEYGSGMVNRRCVMEQGFDAFYGLYSFSGS